MDDVGLFNVKKVLQTAMVVVGRGGCGWEKRKKKVCLTA